MGRVNLSLNPVLVSFRHVFANPRFRVYATVLGFAYAGLFTYIGVSSFIVQDFYRLREVQAPQFPNPSRSVHGRCCCSSRSRWLGR